SSSVLPKNCSRRLDPRKLVVNSMNDGAAGLQEQVGHQSFSAPDIKNRQPRCVGSQPTKPCLPFLGRMMPQQTVFRITEVRSCTSLLRTPNTLCSFLDQFRDGADRVRKALGRPSVFRR